MIRVMVVDDEQVEREGLKLMLMKKRDNVDIVAEARNGKQAVEFALTYKPELIFMDIKMPEVDGLEAVRRIVAEYPEAKFIMVSAFDTFDYAREAMKFGIKEYLLKPSKMSEVLEAYDRMVQGIEEEKQVALETKQLNHRLNRASSFIETEFIVSLMMDHVHEFNQEDWEDWLHLERKLGFVAVFTFESTTLQPSREEKSSWYHLLKQTIHHHFPNCLVGPLTGYQVPVLRLLTEVEASTDMRELFARKIIHEVQKELKKSRIFAGIGSIVTDAKHFATSYKEAIDVLEFVYTQSSATYMVFNERMKQMQKELVPFELEKELVDAIKTGDSQKGLLKFEQYFLAIEKAAEYKASAIHKAMEHFFIILARSLKDLGYDETIQTNVGYFSTSTQIKEAAKNQILTITHQVAEFRSNGIHTLLLQAKEYIDNHYHHAVSLDEVAENIGISTFYLSKLFKEKFQVTFIDYLTSTRLEKAKELLLGKMSLKEIAFDIGYKDPNYFSRVFKKELGLSPSEYRAKYQR